MGSENEKRENELIEKLKEMWDDNNQQEDRKVSAKVFHEMAEIYKNQAPDKTSLIRSAVLYNAALVRSPKSLEVKEGLKDLCKVVLKSASSVLKDAEAGIENIDLIKLGNEVKSKFVCLRNIIKNDLDQLERFERSFEPSDQLPFCQEWIDEMIKLQEKITSQYIEIMSQLTCSCLDFMEPAPCEFALVGMGSLARKEITPFSDFEHIIVLDDKIKNAKDYKRIENYFEWFSVIFEIALINMQETIVPNVVIKGLNNHPDYGDWFYDRITPRGICFDSMLPHACKFPLGRQEPTERKPWKTKLIKPTSEMLNYLTTDEDLKNGYNLKDVLTKVCFIAGEKENVFDDFESKINKKLNEEDSRAEIILQITKDMENFSIRSHLTKKVTKSDKINLKKVIYRSITLFITALGRLKKISSSSCSDIIKDLAEKKNISESQKGFLLFAVALACELRLKWYMKHQSQKDEIEQTPDQKAIQILTSLTESKNLVVFFKVSYALQCDLANNLNLKKKHFYSDLELLKVILSYCFQEKKDFAQQVITSFDGNCSLNERLKSMEQAFEILFQKPEATQSLTDSVADETPDEKITNPIFQYGELLRKASRDDDASVCFELILDFYETHATEKPKIYFMAMHRLAECLKELENFVEAEEWFQQIIRMQKDKPMNEETTEIISFTLDSLGEFYKEMKKFKKALDCHKNSFEMDVEKWKIDNFSVTLYHIGECYKEMEKYEKALNYLHTSLEMDEQIPSDVENEDGVAATLHSIAECHMKMKNFHTAIKFFQNSIFTEEKRKKSGEKYEDMSKTYQTMGECYMEMKEFKEALTSFQESLDIDMRLSHGVETDHEVAVTLQSIGECYMKMERFTIALDHLKWSLKIDEQRSTDTESDSNIAITLKSIGECYMKMGNLTEALDHFQRLLKIYERRSTNTDSDFDIAVTLKSIGECYMRMGNFNDAFKQFERASIIQK